MFLYYQNVFLYYQNVFLHYQDVFLYYQNVFLYYQNVFLFYHTTVAKPRTQGPWAMRSNPNSIRNIKSQLNENKTN